MTPRPEPGQKAPAFSAPVAGGGFKSGAKAALKDFKGRPLVLYFYPKDDTPGCTRQACALRDGWARVSEKAQVLGVSGDSIASHEKFIKKHALPFPILSDEDHAIATAYGVWVEKSMYGKKHMGIERATFIIGPGGVITAVFPKVKPDEHLSRVLAAL